MTSSSIGTSTGPARFRRRLVTWAPPVAWAAIIFVLSSVPGSDLPTLPGQSDKLVHGTVYAILGALCFRAVALTWTWPRRPAVAIATLLALLYGVSDEIHQTFTAHRTPDWRDALADMIGGVVGALVYAAVTSRARRPMPRQDSPVSERGRR